MPHIASGAREVWIREASTIGEDVESRFTEDDPYTLK